MTFFSINQQLIIIYVIPSNTFKFSKWHFSLYSFDYVTIESYFQNSIQKQNLNFFPCSNTKVLDLLKTQNLNLAQTCTFLKSIKSTCNKKSNTNTYSKHSIGVCEIRQWPGIFPQQYLNGSKTHYFRTISFLLQ